MTEPDESYTGRTAQDTEEIEKKQVSTTRLQKKGARKNKEMDGSKKSSEYFK